MVEESFVCLAYLFLYLIIPCLCKILIWDGGPGHSKNNLRQGFVFGKATWMGKERKSTAFFKPAVIEVISTSLCDI